MHLGTAKNTTSRTIGAMALRKSNEQGGLYFMLMCTGIQIHAHQWKYILIEGYVIDCVEKLVGKEAQPEMPNE